MSKRHNSKRSGGIKVYEDTPGCRNCINTNRRCDGRPGRGCSACVTALLTCSFSNQANNTATRPLQLINDTSLAGYAANLNVMAIQNEGRLRRARDEGLSTACFDCHQRNPRAPLVPGTRCEDGRYRCADCQARHAQSLRVSTSGHNRGRDRR